MRDNGLEMQNCVKVTSVLALPTQVANPSLLEFKLQPDSESHSPESVYKHIEKHQAAEQPWKDRENATFFQIWFHRFNNTFSLNIFEFVISLSALPRTKFSHFRRGYTGSGLRGEITINSHHVDGPLPDWLLLAALLLEMLHAWEQQFGQEGKTTYRSAAYRQKAEILGLIVDEQGRTTVRGNGPFAQVLRRHSIDVPAEDIKIPRGPAGNSKSKLYICECLTRARCATDLQAICLKCNTQFMPALKR